MRTPRALRAALLAVAGVNAASALAGMVGLILGDGMGLPRSALDATPFDSWVWPASLLGVVVGGAQLLAGSDARYPSPDKCVLIARPMMMLAIDSARIGRHAPFAKTGRRWTRRMCTGAARRTGLRVRG